MTFMEAQATVKRLQPMADAVKAKKVHAEDVQAWKMYREYITAKRVLAAKWQGGLV